MSEERGKLPYKDRTFGLSKIVNSDWQRFSTVSGLFPSPPQRSLWALGPVFSGLISKNQTGLSIFGAMCWSQIGLCTWQHTKLSAQHHRCCLDHFLTFWATYLSSPVTRVLLLQQHVNLGRSSGCLSLPPPAATHPLCWWDRMYKAVRRTRCLSLNITFVSCDAKLILKKTRYFEWRDHLCELFEKLRHRFPYCLPKVFWYAVEPIYWQEDLSVLLGHCINRC